MDNFNYQIYNIPAHDYHVLVGKVNGLQHINDILEAQKNKAQELNEVLVMACQRALALQDKAMNSAGVLEAALKQAGYNTRSGGDGA